MFYSIEAELPSGTRLRLQRDAGKYGQGLWVATFAAFQFVIRVDDTGAFSDRARLWAEGCLTGASLDIAFSTIRQFVETVHAVEAAIDGEAEARRKAKAGGAA